MYRDMFSVALHILGKYMVFFNMVLQLEFPLILFHIQIRPYIFYNRLVAIIYVSLSELPFQNIHGNLK